jgi:hypothetical protein
MTKETFFSQLIANLNFPFEISDVSEIESNCGSTCITLQDRSSYFIAIEKCENLDDQ